ncbi:MAG: aldo/keto reductase [Phycisphaeraceae bacterium]
MMIHRTLGRTGLQVSPLGFGAMRLPMIGKGADATVDRDKAIAMIHRAFSAGVNYIDTAVGYCKQESQQVVGQALKGWRDRVVVSTKNHYYGDNEKEWWTNLENSLQRLDVDTIDIYNHHGISWDKYANHVQPLMHRWMLKAQAQGLIRHIATSFHDNADALRKIVDSGYVSVVTVQYNLLDRSLEDAIAHAQAQNVGVVVMGPVGGGRLGVPSDVLSSLVPGVVRVPELALRFVLANPNVTLALSGMSTMEQVAENVAVAADPMPLSGADHQAIAQHLERLKQMADLYCTGCGYCKPCPNEVDIPEVFGLFNMGRVYGLWDEAKRRYGHVTRQGHGSDKCAQCGHCLDKCPQHIAIMDRLEEAHAALQ